MILNDTGPITVPIDIDGVGVVYETIYPWCGMTVETEVWNDGSVTVQPNTYTRRAVFE